MASQLLGNSAPGTSWAGIGCSLLRSIVATHWSFTDLSHPVRNGFTLCGPAVLVDSCLCAWLIPSLRRSCCVYIHFSFRWCWGDLIALSDAFSPPPGSAAGAGQGHGLPMGPSHLLAACAAEVQPAGSAACLWPGSFSSLLWAGTHFADPPSSTS